MKIDLVGSARRGLAMGINEAAGYMAVSLAAIAASYLAATYALQPQPFLLGIGFALAGLLLSLLFVRESHGHARHEAALLAHPSGQDRKSTRLNSSHSQISYAVFCLKKKNKNKYNHSIDNVCNNYEHH